MKKRIWKIWLALVVFLAIVAPGSAEIIIVDDDWPYDFDNIQAAIDYSSNGDTIFVFPGTYTGEGNRDIDFNGKAITVQSVDPEDPYIVSITIIDCNGTWEDEHHGFSFHSGEDANSVIDGLTITNGYARRPGYGGGIWCMYSSPTITNCVIIENTATSRGGGIFCEFSSPIITNCTIRNNTAIRGNGGGISCRDANPTITNCTISENSAETAGGGFFNRDGSSPSLFNCTFIGNWAGVRGGGMSNIENSNPTLTNCTFSGNVAHTESGGAMHNDNANPTLTNCTFSQNYGFYVGGIVNTMDCTLTNCILWGNSDSEGTGESAQIEGGTPDVSFSCIQDDDPNDEYIPFGESNGNIDDNPMFVRDPNDGGDGWGDNPETPEIDEGENDDFGDLHLQSSSPCINAGHPTFIAAPDSVDIDGQPRVIGLRIDMGADEFAPMVIVTEPEGGEVWVSGSIHEITWDSYIYQDTVNILFSEDNGSNWEIIEGSVVDTGSYIWYLPDVVDSEQCLILIVPSVPDVDVLCIESGLFTIHPDFIHPAVPSRWKSLGGDFTRTGLSENYGPELGCVKWQFETDGAVSASVTIGAGDRVHIACEDGKIYTLDSSDGLLLWSYDTNSPLLSSPTIGPHGSVYVGSKNGKLYAISIGGNLRWTHNTDGFIYSSPAVSPDGTVYICSQDGTLYALGQDGSELWSFETGGSGVIGGSVFASPAIGADGAVYITGLYDPNLYALNPNDGNLKWVCNLTDPCAPNSKAGWPFASPVVAEDSIIYQVLLYDPNLYAIEPDDGNVIWSLDLADPYSGWFDSDYADRYGYADGWSEPALGPDGTIYVSFDDPYLRAVDPNGSIKWITRLGMMGGFTLTVGSDGLIYAASDDGYLCVVNPDGEEIARFRSDDWLNFPVIAADNTIIVSGAKDNTMIVTDANNSVWAIGGDDCEDKVAALHRPQDLNTDWGVDFKDFALLAADWLECTDMESYPWWYPSPCDDPGDEIYLEGDVNRDLYVDFADLAALAERWLSEE